MGAFVFSIIFLTYAYVIREFYLELKSDSTWTRRNYWQAVSLHLSLFVAFLILEPNTIYAIHHYWDFNWASSDQAYMFRTLNGILENFNTPSRFPIGVYGIISPIELIFNHSGTSPLNWKLVPFFFFLLIPMGYLGLSRIFKYFSGAKAKLSILWSVIFLLTLAYILIPPDWVQNRYSQYGARRVLMLVFGAEVFSFPIIIYSWLILFKPSNLKNSLMLGGISALLLMNSERNIVFVGLILAVSLFKNYRHLWSLVLSLIVTYIPQLVYQVSTFGWSPTAARRHHWVSNNRANYWAEKIDEMYTVALTRPLKQISLEYVPDNLNRFTNWWVYLLAAIAAVVLVFLAKHTRSKKKPWFETIFFLTLSGIIFANMLLALIYINPHVNFRYFSANIPIMALAVSIAIAGLQKMLREDHVDKPVVFFDGVCNLCNGFIDWIIRHDRKELFLFSSLQSESATALSKNHQLPPSTGPDPDSIFVLSNGVLYQRSRAFIEILMRLGGIWRIAILLKIIPSPLRDLIYNVVAKNRYRWFGRRDSCRLPTSSEKRRFL